LETVARDGVLVVVVDTNAGVVDEVTQNRTRGAVGRYDRTLEASARAGLADVRSGFVVARHALASVVGSGSPELAGVTSQAVGGAVLASLALRVADTASCRASVVVMRSTEAEVGDRGRRESLHGGIADGAGVVGATCALEAVDMAWLANNLHSIVVCAWSTKTAGSIGESLSHVAGQTLGRKRTRASHTCIMARNTGYINIGIAKYTWTRIRNKLSLINRSTRQASSCSNLASLARCMTCLSHCR